MALEAYLDSFGQLAVPLVASTHGSGGLLESLGSTMLLQSDGLSVGAVGSHFSSENLSASVARMARLHANLVYDDQVHSSNSNNGINSGANFGASSLVTDDSSSQVVGAYLQRSGSANMDSYLNLPSSPLSFSSSNLSNSVVEDSTMVQPSSFCRDENSQLGQKRLLPQGQVDGPATTQGVSVHTGRRECGSTQKYKKPRLDMIPENMLHRQIIQQLLQKQDPMELQNQQMQVLMQQYKLQNQQQRHILQSIPQFVGIAAQEQQQQRRHHLQQQANHQVSAVLPLHGGMCSRRLMQYIYHLRHRPSDNSIAYWRKFVAEYYAPGAKQRWCLSLYDRIGEHALGVFSPATMEAWHCEICDSKSGKGFEAVFEMLPRLSKIKFESGVVDEILFLDFPNELRLPSGLMMLSYGKAVQESIYEQFRVVREGQLRVIFNHELKIISWEFCARRHEELVPRKLIAPQVNQLIQAAKKCQSSSKDGGCDGVSPHALHLNCNMFVTAGHQLAQNLELLVNDLGFSKRYVRCLQIAEVVNSMKDLMTFSSENNIGPMESLRRYPRREAKCPDTTSSMNERSCLTKDGAMTSPGKTLLGETNSYQESLPRPSPSLTKVKLETCSSVNPSNQRAVPLPIPSPQLSSLGITKSSTVPNLSTSQLTEGSENLQQRLIHRILQQMVSNSKKAKGAKNASRKVKEEVLEEFDRSAEGELSRQARGAGTVGKGSCLGNTNASISAVKVFDGSIGRMDCLRTASDLNSSCVYGNNSSLKGEPDILGRFNLPEAVREMDRDFFGNGVFSKEWKDENWKP